MLTILQKLQSAKMEAEMLIADHNYQIVEAALVGDEASLKKLKDSLRVVKAAIVSLETQIEIHSRT